MIGKKIKERREELGLSQEQLASLLGIGKSAVSNYETNVSSPKETILLKLFDVLQCDANYLYEDFLNEAEEFTISSTEKRNIKKYRTLDEYGKKLIDGALEVDYERCALAQSQPVFTFRRLNSNKASAGTGFDLNDPDQWRSIEVVDTPEARQADFAVEVEGRSMEPDYYDGDIVYISLASEIPVGQVGLFIQNGRGYIKEAGEGRLISRNPEYDDIFPEDGNIECKGRVIGVAELAE